MAEIVKKRNLFFYLLYFQLFITSCGSPKIFIKNEIVFNKNDSLFYFETYIFNKGYDSLYLVSSNELMANYDVFYYSKSNVIKPMTHPLISYSFKTIINNEYDTFYSPIPFKKLDRFDSLKVVIPIFLNKESFEFGIQDKCLLDSCVFYKDDFDSLKIINKKFPNWFSRYI